MVLSCGSEEVIEPSVLDQTFEETFTVEAAPNPEKWWNQMNGIRMNYLQGTNRTFARIESNLDEWYDDGYRMISFYCVYDGDVESFFGLGPKSFYRVESSAGMMEDFESLVAAADAKGMKILSWINLGYSIDSNEDWIKAQEDKRDGIDSKESRWFRWAETDPTPDENCDGDECFDWAYSEIAESWYKLSWGRPAFDWASEDWQQEVKNILEFWHDKGIDGWVFDAAEYLIDHNYATTSIFKTYVGDVCTAADVIIIPEASNTSLGWTESCNFLSVYDNKAGSWLHDDYNVATRAIDAEDASIIETRLAAHTDVFKNAGKITFSYDPEGYTPKKRPLEIALMTSLGILYETHFGLWNYGSWQNNVNEVFKTINSTSALAPGAARTWLSNDNEAVYSMVKTSMDGLEKVLCVFNLSEDSVSVGLNLEGSGFSTKQVMRDLVNPDQELLINQSPLTVDLAGLSYKFYQLQNQ